jgi:hypothetical protein
MREGSGGVDLSSLLHGRWVRSELVGQRLCEHNRGADSSTGCLRLLKVNSRRETQPA